MARLCPQPPPGGPDGDSLATLTRAAILTASALVLFSFACVIGFAIALTGGIPFDKAQLVELGTFLPNVFMQQFFFCSVSLATLSTLPVFRGLWRLPLLSALCFGISHMYLPVKIPGTFIPFQVVVTMPIGFVFAWYFLKYRSIVWSNKPQDMAARNGSWTNLPASQNGHGRPRNILGRCSAFLTCAAFDDPAY